MVTLTRHSAFALTGPFVSPLLTVMDPTPVTSAHPEADALYRLYPSRFFRSYAYWKVRTDPLYHAVSQHLITASNQPLIDLGCGAGLLAFYLKIKGHKGQIKGLDLDRAKIQAARQIAAVQWPDLTFEVADFSQWTPGSFTGHVTLLDVLQYLSSEAQIHLLEKAATCLTHPDQRLIIRNGLDDDSWRATVTRATDHLACWIRWMVRSPTTHPTRRLIEQTLAQVGLCVEFSPLWGGTPFNNYLIVARRPAHT